MCVFVKALFGRIAKEEGPVAGGGVAMKLAPKEVGGVFVCKSVCLSVCVCLCVFSRANVCVLVRTHVWLERGLALWAEVCACVCVFVCICVCACVRACMYMHACVHVHM